MLTKNETGPDCREAGLPQGTREFYDELADSYHLIFDDWQAAIDRQAKVLARLLDAEWPQEQPLNILDCACGIGTQALAFAGMGHRVTGTDLSSAAIDRARFEAKSRGLAIDFAVANMCDLNEVQGRDFDLVAAFDNALPHLARPELERTARAISSKLTPGGLFLASIRDYDVLMLTKPAIQTPAFFGDAGSLRIVHQVWDWISDREYVVHLYITLETASGWEVKHFVSTYHCLLRDELTGILEQAGFTDVRWRMPEESGLYQPVVIARWPG